MTTGYTQSQLDDMYRVLLQEAPPLMSAADVANAFPVLNAAWNGSYTTFVLQLGLAGDQHLEFEINCVVALELMNGINDRAHEFGWWDDVEPGNAPGDMLPMCKPSASDKAPEIIALVTSATPDGMLVHFKDANKQGTIVFLPRSVARGVAIAVTGVGEKANWWDEDFNLLPAQIPDDLTVQRAAQQFVKQYGAQAGVEAAQRANRANAARDQFNHELWTRVWRAVVAMGQAKPGEGHSTH